MRQQQDLTEQQRAGHDASGQQNPQHQTRDLVSAGPENENRRGARRVTGGTSNGSIEGVEPRESSAEHGRTGSIPGHPGTTVTPPLLVGQVVPHHMPGLSAQGAGMLPIQLGMSPAGGVGLGLGQPGDLQRLQDIQMQVRDVVLFYLNCVESGV